MLVVGCCLVAPLFLSSATQILNCVQGLSAAGLVAKKDAIQNVFNNIIELASLAVDVLLTDMDRQVGAALQRFACRQPPPIKSSEEIGDDTPLGETQGSESGCSGSDCSGSDNEAGAENADANDKDSKDAGSNKCSQHGDGIQQSSEFDDAVVDARGKRDDDDDDDDSVDFTDDLNANNLLSPERDEVAVEEENQTLTPCVESAAIHSSFHEAAEVAAKVGGLIAVSVAMGKIRKEIAPLQQAITQVCETVRKVRAKIISRLGTDWICDKDVDVDGPLVHFHRTQCTVFGMCDYVESVSQLWSADEVTNDYATNAQLLKNDCYMNSLTSLCGLHASFAKADADDSDACDDDGDFSALNLHACVSHSGQVREFRKPEIIQRSRSSSGLAFVILSSHL